MNNNIVICPHCRKKLKIVDNEREFICPYCEKPFILKGDVPAQERTNSAESTSVNRNTKKKKKSLVPFFAILGIIAVLLVLAFVFKHQIINLFTTPEGHPTDEPKPWDSAETESSDPVDTVEVPDDPGDRVYNLLICGQDKVSGLTDVNLLISFNVTQLSMSVMQIPRDTNMTPDGYWYDRANGVFGCYGANKWDSDNSYIQSVLDKYDENTESDLRGIAGFAALLEQNLCVKIHYYAVMDLSGFRNIVDALGGVYMNVPFDLNYDDDMQDLHIHINQGYQLLDGDSSEGIVRYRSGYALADIARGNVQKMFMASLIKTLKDNVSIFNADKIIKVCGIIADNLVTNMTTSDMIYFANNAMMLDMSNVTFMTAPVGGFYSSETGTWYTCINKAATLELINEYFNIYKDPVTEEEFDANKVFYLDSEWYSGPSSMVPKYIYSASEMTDSGFSPVVGY